MIGALMALEAQSASVPTKRLFEKKVDLSLVICIETPFSFVMSLWHSKKQARQQNSLQSIR
jgi:hypothetical protein